MCFRNTPPKPKPIERHTISSQRLYDIIREKFPRGTIHISDYGAGVYSLCDIQDIEAFLDYDQTNHNKYVKERFDCDNFARMLWGAFGTTDWAHFAIGLFWSDIHAMVMCVDSNEDVWIIEPQTDKRRSDLLDCQGTILRFVIF